MSTPAHRRKTTQPDYFPPVPDGAIPAQRRPDAGVHRAGGKPGRGRLAAGVALVLAAAVGAGWLLLSPSSADDGDGRATASGLAQVPPSPGAESPRLTGRIPAGSFDVGHEAEAGVYRTGGASVLDGSAGCRWQVSGGGVGPLVGGGTTSGPATVTLRPGTDFTSIGCQDWVRVG